MTRRVAHTASFLQTFHTAQSTADRRAAAGAEGSEPKAAPADAEAMAFVKFAQPARDNGYTAEVSGWTVRFGNDLLTEPQAKFVIGIAISREGVTDAMIEALKIRLEQGFAKHAASQFITRYKDLPRKSQDAARAEAIAPGAETSEVNAVVAKGTEVPAGRYALRTDDVVKFYRLDRPTQGKWAGYVFLKAQASDELYPIRNRTEKDRILDEISKDVNGSAMLYGQELGKCYRCGRTLTDETSREMGIGPECRKKS